MNAQTFYIAAAPVIAYDSVPTRASLLSRLRDVGDDASWRVFFETYWRLIYNLARRSGLADSDAQDIVQETVISVARRIPEFRYDPRKGSFKHWLLLIARRRIQDHLRTSYRAQSLVANAREAERFGADELPEVPSPVLAPDAAVAAAWEADWREHFFQAALATVRSRANPKSYQAFDYCVLQGIKPSQVARMLGWSAAQVYLAKHRMSAEVRRVAKSMETRATRSAGANL